MSAYSKREEKKITFENPISVSEYISVINKILSGIEAKVIGEISQIKTAESGHVYLSLKDEKSGDIINCAIWKSIYRMCAVELETGMKVIVSGNCDIYGPRGSLTFKIKTVEPAGEGALKIKYERLKKKLTQEGYFDEGKKREISKYPEKIGVITSRKGAAIHDFINNLGKFGFKVQICDSRVEGQEAIKDLLESIRAMKKQDLDILVIIRGGGSLQSLIAFDNELLVKEIASFPVPVIAGIGHHEDITLSALAADISESTPTAAANKVSEGFYEAKEKFALLKENIEGRYQDIIYQKKEGLYFQIGEIKEFFKDIFETYRRGEEKVMRTLSRITYQIGIKEKEIKVNEDKINSSFKKEIKKTKNNIERIKEFITTNDPKRQLALGYSIMKKNNKIIKSVNNLKVGEETDIVLNDGEVNSQVKKIKKYDKKG